MLPTVRDDARGRPGVSAVALVVEDAVDAAVPVGELWTGHGTAPRTSALTAPERTADRVTGRVGSFDAGQAVSARALWCGDRQNRTARERGMVSRCEQSSATAVSACCERRGAEAGTRVPVLCVPATALCSLLTFWWCSW